MMVTFVAQMIAIQAIRWARAVGYRGRHALALVTTLLTAASLGICILGLLLNHWVRGGMAQASGFGPTLAGLVIVLVHLLSGVILVAVVMSRSGAERLRATLTALPFARREADALVLAPVMAFAALQLLLLGWLGTAVLLGLGLGVATSALLCGAAALLGAALVCAIGLLIQWLSARSSSVAAVELPLLLLSWLAAQGLVISASSSAFQGPVSGLASRLALLPVVVGAACGTGAPIWMAGLVCLPALAVIALWAAHAAGAPVRRGGSVVWLCRPAGPLGAVGMELTRILRCRPVTANGLGVAVLGLLPMLGLVRLGQAERAALAGWLVPALMLTIAVPLTMIRATSARFPAQLMLGKSPARWVGEVTLAATLPVSALGILIVGSAVPMGVWTWDLAWQSGLDLLMCVAVATAISWVLGAASNSPLTQSVNAFLYFIGGASLLALLAWRFAQGTWEWVVISLAITLGAFSLPPVLETIRWAAKTRMAPPQVAANREPTYT